MNITVLGTKWIIINNQLCVYKIRIVLYEKNMKRKMLINYNIMNAPGLSN